MRHPYKTALLVIGDILVLYFSLALTLAFRYGSLAEAPLVREHFAPFSIVFAFWVVVFFIHNLYDFTAAKNTLEFYRTVVRAFLINATVALAFFYLIPYFSISPKRNLFLFLVIFFIIFALWRQIANRLFKTHLHAPTLIMGADRFVSPLAETLNRNPQVGYRVVGVLTDEIHSQYERSFFTYTRKDFLNLPSLVEEYGIETIIVEETILQNKEVIQALDKLIESSIAILDFHEFKERFSRKIDLGTINEMWFLEHVAKGRNITYSAIKRVIDIFAIVIFALPAIVIGAVAALIIKLQDGGSIFYRQVRTGQYGTPFSLVKFRTMVPDAEKRGAQLTVDADPRVTRMGRLLRKTRLDELPQFWNILKGEMSFVGPRAERPEFDEGFVEHVPFYERRYLMKPGVTGWAQINYPSVMSMHDAKERMAYDFFYLKYRSLVFDIAIILRTIDIMLRGRGR